MSKSAALPELMTVGGVAQLLGVTDASVYRWINASQLPAVRLSAGGPIRVRSDHLAQWLEAKGTTNV
jgi:excisionase family DNA binding protein